MSDLDRLYRYKSLLTSRHAVPTQELMDALGVSVATLKRDMAKLRERLNIPVVYDRMAGGYSLAPGHGRKELPGLWLSPSEIVALATLQHLLSDFVPGVMSDKLRPLKERLTQLLHDVNLDAAGLARRIQIVHAGQRQVLPSAFENAAAATLGRRQLRLTHYNRESGQTLKRTVSPQQLVHYRDNWYLDTWCHLRQAFRSFAVDAIQACEVLDEPATELEPDALTQATKGSYGIFSGTGVHRAQLRFSAQRARWVSQEIWHPEQTGSWQADGTYLLELPYGDDRELLGDILRHGPDCEVLAPANLRQKVIASLQQSLRAYRD